MNNLLTQIDEEKSAKKNIWRSNLADAILSYKSLWHPLTTDPPLTASLSVTVRYIFL
jgi:hypothetical protein